MAGIDGLSLTTTSGLENLISQYIQLERQPITLLKSRQDDLKVRRAVYDDLNQKLTDLRSAVQELSGAGSTLNQFPVKASSADAKVAGVTAASGAAAGQYNVTVNRLAQPHQLSSLRQTSSNTALKKSGIFYVGGANQRAVTNPPAAGTAVDTFGPGADLLSGVKELASGQYFVEVRQENSAWQFRLVDEKGDAVQIAKGTTTELTDSWQALGADLLGKSYDTGRGLKINFKADPTAGLKGSGAASVTYTAQGGKVEVQAEDSLYDIRDAINGAAYAEGHEVRATVVDNTLVLTSSRSGDSAHIDLADSDGVLNSLGLLSRSWADTGGLTSSKGVAGFDVADPVEFIGGGLTGLAELARGRYFVEINSSKQFRLLDAAGSVVSIASSSASSGGSSTATTDWVSIPAGPAVTYNTGRGLTINFKPDGEGAYDPARFASTGGTAANVFFQNPTTGSPVNALLSVNGQYVSRSSNTGLNDIMANVTLNLTGAGSTQVTVTQDQDAVVSKVKTLVTKLNDLVSYLKAKTEPVKDESASTDGKPAYKRGALANDYSLTSLHRNLVSDFLGRFSGAAGGPAYLADLGIKLSDEDLSFELSNSDALKSALSQNLSGVTRLFDSVLGKMENRLKPYLDGTKPLIKSSQDAIDQEVENIDDRVKDGEARLKVRENALRQQFQAMQAQILTMQYQSQSYQAVWLGSYYNQQS